MKLLVVIVNYRTCALTLDAVTSLSSQLPVLDGCGLIVVDNASGDGSAAQIAAAIRSRGWSSWVHLLPANRNGGFAAGNNLAIRAALASADPPNLVMLLNPDTIVRPGAIAALLGFMKSHPDVAMAGSRLEDPDGTRHVSSFRFPGVLSELERALRTRISGRLLARWAVALPHSNRPRQVDWVSGAAFTIRRQVFERIGLLDEDYFLYFEEVDFCLRARRAGFECWDVPDSRVVHFVGRSTGVTDPPRSRSRLPDYWFRSRRRYFVRNLGTWRAGLADAAWIGGHLISRTWRTIARKPRIDPENLLKDFVRGSAFGTHLAAARGKPFAAPATARILPGPLTKAYEPRVPDGASLR